MAAANYFVTPAGANGKTGADWENAMGEAEFEADLEANAEPGDVYYIASGTYTLDSAYDSSAKDGTAAAPISIIGVNSGLAGSGVPTYAQWADANIGGEADNRPVFACGANAVTFGDYYKVYNCAFTGEAANVVTFGSYNVMYNLKGSHSSSSANRVMFVVALGTAAVLCEAIGVTNFVCTGFNLGNTSKTIFCTAHDCNTGFSLGSNASSCLFCIAEDCATVGFSLSTRLASLIMNCTGNDCADGVTGSTGAGVFINNLLEGCTSDGFYWSTQSDVNFFIKNHGNDTRNTDMWDGVATTMPHMDPEVTSGDPKFTADGNLSLQSDSPCIDAALALTLGVG